MQSNKLTITATDLDIIFYDEINEVKIEKTGSTTTSASILYDILRKISGNSGKSIWERTGIFGRASSSGFPIKELSLILDTSRSRNTRARSRFNWSRTTLCLM